MEKRKIKLLVSVDYQPELLHNIRDNSNKLVDQVNEEPTGADIALMDEKIKVSVKCALDNLFDDAFQHPGRKDYLLNHGDASYDVVRYNDLI